MSPMEPGRGVAFAPPVDGPVQRPPGAPGVFSTRPGRFGVEGVVGANRLALSLVCGTFTLPREGPFPMRPEGALG